MSEKIQNIVNLVQQSNKLSEDLKNTLVKTLNDADKEISIATFKIERLEKVKYTTTVLLEQTIEELESKRKSVEEQKRELEIEASLERVRAIAMGMREPDDMLGICRAIAEELKNLNVNEIRNVQTAIFYEEKGIYTNYEFYVKHGKTIVTETEFRNHQVAETFARQMTKGPNEFFTYSFTGNEVKDWLEYQKGTNVFIDNYLETATSLTYYWYSLGPVALGISTYEPLTSEGQELFKRFRNVFELAYRRYLDIEKAQAQARESQIQLALERVRARTMAMQHSDELSETAHILFQQFRQLGEDPIQITIGIFNEEQNIIEFRVTGGDGSGSKIEQTFNASMDEPMLMNKLFRAWRENKKSTVISLAGKELSQWIAYRNKISGEYAYPTEVRADDRRYVAAGFFSKGVLSISKTQDPSGETIQILERFASVFDLAYTRFLDLKNAEAQAREARIEAALEKVRSRSLAMHKSDELQEVVNTVFEKLKELDVDFYTVIIVIFQKNSKDVEWWMQNKVNQQYPKILIRYADIRYLRDVFEAKQNGKQLLSTCYAGKDKNELYNYLLECTDLKYVAGEQKKFLLEREFATISVAIAKNTGIHITSYSKKSFSREETETLKRFAMVFEQAYVRFIDLQKAELQAKEAAIETALEKVRSRTLAMQKSNELAETASVLFRQLILMGIAANRLYINVVKDENANSEFWITDEDGTKVSSAFEANLAENSTFKKMYDGWKEQKTSQVIDMQGKELQEYFAFLNSIHVPFKGGLLQQRRVQTIAYFSHGFIGLASPEPQPEETLHLLERFASVFNLTFTRFNDLKIAEAHAEQAEQDLIQLKAEKKKTEEALTNLKATQSQLVQAEKMASLGELTAGIAHEIQNPLNFINNFSEVSGELLDEMKTELDKGDTEEARIIADDVKQNLEKILNHGKRADAIVKGMLQHSRSSTGQKEPTDINALADEYLRLAYHGLRAKDKSFNAKFEAYCDNTIGKINIIPQDIGRVILNLINNAFYEVTEKKKQLSNGYEPAVIVSTKKINDKVELRVIDNGSGIPPKVLDKIFQPFFTTKPTGEGTGLGLSLSYDIITRGHGGELKVETKEGEGSTFIVQLPANSVA